MSTPLRPRRPSPNRQEAARGTALALVGAALWGTTGTSQALLAGSPTPVAVGGLRILMAAALMLVPALAAGPRRWAATLAAGRWPWVLLAGLVVSGYQLTFFAAVARTGVAVGTLVMLATAPLVTGLAGWLVHRLRPSRTWAVATLVALSGAALLVLGSGAARPLDVGGLLLGITSGACFGLFSFVGREVTLRGGEPVCTTSWVFLVAAAVLALPLAGQDLAFAGQPRNTVVLLWLGVAATAAAYLCYQLGLRGIDAPTAATLALVEPMVASLLAVLVLGEAFTSVMGLGVALVLAGLAILARA